jgi:hypothetical protein
MTRSCPNNLRNTGNTGRQLADVHLPATASASCHETDPDGAAADPGERRV